MPTPVFVALACLAIVVMIYGFLRVLKLRARIPGGEARAAWSLLTGFIAFFLLAYLATPFFPMLPAGVKDALIGTVFMGGAIFVVLVIRLFDKIVTDLGL